MFSDWIVERITEQTGIDPSGDIKALQRILEEAEKIKCELSTLKTPIFAKMI